MESTTANNLKRKPLEGIRNIIWFNWPFFLSGLLLLVALFITATLFTLPFSSVFFWMGIAGIVAFFIPLFVSWYVYDYTDLYKMKWLQWVPGDKPLSIININAGFDETSHLLQNIYPSAQLDVYDFYDPLKHTEPSIRRARNSRAPFPGTQSISTSDDLKLNRKADWICLFFAAHEIRNEEERAVFFAQLSTFLEKNGKIIVLEHVRDVPNFIAWNLGAFHFHSLKTWEKTFNQANLQLIKRKKINPFVSLLILSHHGPTP